MNSRSILSLKKSPVILDLFLALLFLSPAIFTAYAVDLLTIRDIIDNSQNYQLHLVDLEGVVRNLQVSKEPYVNIKTGLRCYGAYTFTLEDSTGSIEVSARGICGSGEIVPPEVSEGEKVTFEAQIQASGHYGGDGLPITGEDRTAPRALLTHVRHIEK